MESEKTKPIANGSEETTIDLKHILLVLWKRVWLILLCGVLAAALSFAWATNMITPTYSSTVMMYVNTSLTAGGINLSQLSLAQSLINTYIVILNNRTTLTKVIEETGLNYSYSELRNMISASPVGDTEIFSVTVTAPNPYDAEKLANAISGVLPSRVSEIIQGTTVRVVDKAIVSNTKTSPNITSFTAKGLLVGIVLACAVIVIIDLLDNVIRDENDILQSYDIPILAKIPDLMNENSSKHRGYYGESRGSGKTKRSDQQDGSIE